jgi:hypothetical protein
VPILRPDGAPDTPAAPNVVQLDATILLALALGSDDATCTSRVILFST